MSGLLLLSAWCVVGGAVGALIGQHSGRLGVGVFLGSLCGVFGWLLLAGAPPRERGATAEPTPERVAEARPDEADANLVMPLSWMPSQDDQPIMANWGQL